MATNFSPRQGSYVLDQFPSIVMSGMKGFHVSASGVIQGHHGPLVKKVINGNLLIFIFIHVYIHILVININTLKTHCF